MLFKLATLIFVILISSLIIILHKNHYKIKNIKTQFSILSISIILALIAMIIAPKNKDIMLDNSQLGVQQNEYYLANTKEPALIVDLNKSDFLQSKKFKKEIDKSLNQSQKDKLKQGSEISVDAKIKLHSDIKHDKNQVRINNKIYNIEQIDIINKGK